MALRALAEVNLAAIERNTARLCQLACGGVPGSGAKLCAVVKANGYGHGVVPVARAALAGGASMLAVATASEALALRAAGVDAPLLVLGALSAEELPDALSAQAELVAWSHDFVAQARALQGRAAESGRNAPLRLHVKLDTGLGRLGTRSEQAALALVHELADAASEVRLAGVMTHLATADSDPEFAAAQLTRFAPFVAAARGVAPTQIAAHAANSAAAMQLPESRLDLIRAGIALYGADPWNRDPRPHGLEPALALRSYVAAVKPIAPGESAGYGRRFIAREPGFIATLPIGYGDGIPRGLADNCDVLIDGHRYPLCGMVSMDNITVNLGREASVQVGAIATLIGSDGSQRQLVEDLAQRLGTINYEVLCGISARVPRTYHRDGTPA